MDGRALMPTPRHHKEITSTADPDDQLTSPSTLPRLGDPDYFDVAYWHDKYLVLAEQPTLPVSVLRGLLERWVDHDGNLIDDGVTELLKLCDQVEGKP
jgi:hypothetical protein